MKDLRSGLAQISVPLAQMEGLPLGLSLVAARGGDEMLLELVQSLRALEPLG